jgi:RimJ/RimL family protein N-acetyltransferase
VETVRYASPADGWFAHLNLPGSWTNDEEKCVSMRIKLARSVVRSWEKSDLASLVAHADNRRIWLNLRDRFPHPYTAHDGRTFIRAVREANPQTVFAIEVDGAAVGCIGFMLQQDVERLSSEIGYWLGEPFWGRGIATEVLAAVTSHAIEQHGLTRLFAMPFASNAASCRVLEKAGYHLEGRLRRSAIKDGVIVDQLQYAFVVPQAGEAPEDPRRTSELVGR